MEVVPRPGIARKTKDQVYLNKTPKKCKIIVLKKTKKFLERLQRTMYFPFFTDVSNASTRPIGREGDPVQTPNLANHNHRHPAFTLIELLVVITIIAVIIALLIPAVHASREAARRANCSANLKQIGIALNSYVSITNVFPQANNGNKGYSPHSMILPQLENRIIFDSINFNHPFSDESNQTVLLTQLSIFACPSDQVDRKQGGWTNYAGNVGYGYQLNKKFYGVFVNSPDLATFAGIVDGASSTAMMAEWVQGSGHQAGVRDKLGTAFWASNSLIAPDQFEQSVSDCMNLKSIDKNLNSYDKGMLWISTSLGRTLYNHNLNINGTSCVNGGFVMEGTWSASSRHSNGINLLFVDGHVQFIINHIDLLVWRSLGTKSGSEVISAEKF